ncbi:hypothetical protein E4U23_006770 [Claviceps purpurea]|nr:hypothetical protein E4U23_006770 [Claviceps purpurea]KAG6309919.1 hypothetical protein E4U44_006218 [Claviceps purpurea]
MTPQTNLALVLEQTLIDCGIKDGLGYTMSDNATSNDACVEALTLRCCPELMTKEVREIRRLRCFGHIINLCAEAYTRGDVTNDKALRAAQRSLDTPAEEKAWRGKGALGKMRNNIRLFQSSELEVSMGSAMQDGAVERRDLRGGGCDYAL